MNNKEQQMVDTKWEQLAHESLVIADKLRDALNTLEAQRNRLSEISKIAADLQPPGGSEDKKRELVLAWREMVSALDQAGVCDDFASLKGAA